MDLTMVPAAERDRELIAHLAAECTALGEAKVVRIRGHATAEQAGLPGDEPHVLSVSDAPRFRKGQGRLVDPRPRFCRSLLSTTVS
jgi:hypothetical protein